MSIKTYKINSNLAEYTDEEFSAIETLIAQEGIFDVTGTDQDFEVTESAPNAMTVDINTGSALVEYLKNSVTWKVVINSNAVETLSISANTSGSNRVDAIVVHLKQDEPNALKNNVGEVRVILGTGVSALSDSAINTSLGDTNWYRLADITVPDSAVTITNSDITDTRARVTLDALPTDGATNYVELTGNQSVAGIKTFSSFPVTPTALPTTDYQTANKIYVDTEIILADPGVSLITVGENIDGSSTPQASFISRGTVDADAMITESQITQNAGANRDVNGVNFYSQTFTTGTFQDTLTRIDLLLIEVGNPAGNFTMEIFAVDGSSKPTGSALATVTTTATAIGTSSIVWLEFTLASALTVTPATEYAIVTSVVSGTGANYIAWSQGSGNTYSAGQPWSSADAGSTWASLSDDFAFRVWSYETQTAGRVYKSDKDEPFRGGFDVFVVSNTTVGNPATVRIGGIQDSFTGLTDGEDVYTDSTLGAVTHSAGGLRIGRAISTTEINIEAEASFVQIAVISQVATLSPGTTTVDSEHPTLSCGFKPSRVELDIYLSTQTGVVANIRTEVFNGQYVSSLYGTLANNTPSDASESASTTLASNLSTLSVIDGASSATITADDFTLTNDGLHFNVAIDTLNSSGIYSVHAKCYK